MQTFIYFVYRLLQTLGFPFIVLYLVWRGSKDVAYRRTLPERFGGLPFQVTAPGGIWLHAVSVGEVISAVELVRRWRDRYPDTPVHVSVTTVAGWKMAQSKLGHLADGIFYMPLDFVFALRRVLRDLAPTVVVILETEIWPNLWRETIRSGARLVVVNGRISDRALPSYQRFRWFFQHILTLPHRILVQSEQDKLRYLELGAISVTNNGNVKYDFDVASVEPPQEVASFVAELNPEKVLIVASTHAADIDEDEKVIACFPRLSREFPRLLLILAPRHPERFDIVAEKLRVAGIPFVRRTALDELPLPGVLLLDSLGELTGVFRLASGVFIGGTLAQRGGHNILEPAFFGKPVLAGPHMENFAEMAEAFTREGGLLRCAVDEFEDALIRLLNNPRDTGVVAQRLAEARRGAVNRALDVIGEEMERAWPVRLHTFLAWFFLAPLAKLWTWGNRRDRRKTIPLKLDTPVVSIGGIGMGGAGKTPTVLRLARYFENPAILTRGYKRLVPEPVTIVKRGHFAPTDRTGDEAQILVRSALAHVGIGANRAVVGKAMEQIVAPEVFLLDDGFQHYKLARDYDLVLLDGLDPFAGGSPFPLGRLRETPDALERASAILISRAQRGRTYQALRERLPDVPVFFSRVVPAKWVNAATWGEIDPRGKRCVAFCGLANPATFWSTLRQQGIEPIYRWSFDDHHHYRPTEVQRLCEHAQQLKADVLLTTEKDLMNLPSEVAKLLNPIPLLWLRIEAEIYDEEKLVTHIKSRIAQPLV